VVAYSFKPRFVEPILDGRKGGTIRAVRYRHARPGEELQLYTGMRTNRCRLITRKICLACEPIKINFVSWDVSYVISGSRVFQRLPELDAFARFDGFRDFGEMSNFWQLPVFNGMHIRWLHLPCH
jgi:hypothetical protein